MKTKTVKLDDLTKSILLRSQIDGCNLTLPGQLPRPDYERIAKVIEAAGGKWNRQAKCHIFPHPVRDTLDIGNDTVEVTNVQQTFQSFYTPPKVADQLADLAGVKRGHTLLEPSAGEGSLLMAAARRDLDHMAMVAIEVDPRKRAPLLELAGTVLIRDFMEMKVSDETFFRFDRILMNPPFTRGQDIAHIRHAAKFLKPGGILAAICGDGPKQREALKPVSIHWESLPAGTFKSSGTGVSTAMLVIHK